MISAGTSIRREIKPEVIVDRAIMLIIKEAALCLEEKLIDRPDLPDAAIIFGIGFPPFRGACPDMRTSSGLKPSSRS